MTSPDPAPEPASFVDAGAELLTLGPADGPPPPMVPFAAPDPTPDGDQA